MSDDSATARQGSAAGVPITYSFGSPLTLPAPPEPCLVLLAAPSPRQSPGPGLARYGRALVLAEELLAPLKQAVVTGAGLPSVTADMLVPALVDAFAIDSGSKLKCCGKTGAEHLATHFGSLVYGPNAMLGQLGNMAQHGEVAAVLALASAVEVTRRQLDLEWRPADDETTDAVPAWLPSACGGAG